MNNLTIAQTNNTPAIHFSKEGKLKIKGKSIPANTPEFFVPLIDWAAELTVPEVNMDINLEYINSASSKKLIELLKVIDHNSKIKSFIIDWYYEADDEDILENGQIFEKILRKAHFRFHEYYKVA